MKKITNIFWVYCIFAWLDCPKDFDHCEIKSILSKKTKIESFWLSNITETLNRFSFE